MEDSDENVGSQASDETAGRLVNAQDAIDGSAKATDDGRVDVYPESRLCRTLSLFVPDSKPKASSSPPPPRYNETDPFPRGTSTGLRLNIVVQVVGSRGDVQPFVALGAALVRHGHRVRLATHDTFRDFVLAAGLEFFPVGGDPAELMAYMVKNPGLVPNMRSLRAGDVTRKRKMVAQMLGRFWQSCVEPDSVTRRPFVAEAIVANPPSFAHVHCAQALGVPLHLMFTMPWSSTRQFCHPLANLKFREGSKTPRETANYVSYKAVEWMTWQGLGDVVNAWRETLDLEPVPFSEGPGLAEHLKVPFTYCWSPALVPKPFDWPAHIDVCGFFFRQPPTFTPDSELAKFLCAGPPPIYVGFGSIVIEDPEAVTAHLLEAVKATGVRAIISRGWSNLGGSLASDDHVFYLGDCPHEWLFQRVSVVVHHGGAGTTACGLLNGKPTVVVPFFGDQTFWGEMVAAARAGPPPIPQKQLNATNLAEAIRFCLTPEASDAARSMAAQMQTEDGIERAVASFHYNLPLDKMRCDVMPHFAASWTVRGPDRRTIIKLSKEAADVLVADGKIKRDDLKRYESKPTHIELRRWDPVTATASSLAVTTAGMATSAANIFINPIRAYCQSPADNLASSKPPSQSLSDNFSRVSTKSDAEIYGRPAGLDLPPSQTGCSEQKPDENRAMTAFLGSVAGLGGFFKHWTKGFHLDMPLAAAEGLRNAPRLYGGEVYDPGAVTDWKSGGAAAGKNLAHGILEGIGGIVTKPVRGAREDGALGAAKGVGIGLLDLGTKVSSGALGLAAFTGQGLYLSTRATMRRTTRNMIKEARREEGDFAVRAGNAKGLDFDKRMALEAFEQRMLMTDIGDAQH